MYKVVYQNMIIDIIKLPYYVRWIHRYNRPFPSDPTSANGIGSSDNTTFYHVEGMPSFPESCGFKTVKLIPIELDEYNALRSQITDGETVYYDEVEPTEEEKLRRKVDELEGKIESLGVQNRDLFNQLSAARILLGVE